VPSCQPLRFAQYSNKAGDGDDYAFAIKALVVSAILCCSDRKEYEYRIFACDGTERSEVRSIARAAALFTLQKCHQTSLTVVPSSGSLVMPRTRRFEGPSTCLPLPMVLLCCSEETI
jgi:hypothetical protein